VLVVLAMACFPGLAAAEENSGIQYETDVPSVPDTGSNIPPKKKSGGTNPSDGSNPAANESNTPGGVGSGEDEESSAGAGTTQRNPGSGAGDGKAADGSKSAGAVSGAQPIKTVNSATEQAADDGGSSPLVPILIAVAVLAAISIGAYYYRQRRQGPDSTVAPPAS
jgi:cobalamin biosynthesis Mg chelatase CobN